MRRFGTALALLCIGIGACGEAPSPAEQVAKGSSPIIAGKDSDASQDSVVLIMHYDALVQGGGTEGCTGVLLTPELVLTARHCVSVTDGSAACNSDGTALSGGGVQSDFKPDALYVFTGVKRPDFISGAGKAARGKEIITTGAKTICNNDLALLLLDRAVENAKIAPIRLDQGPVRGELITAVGWGITTATNFPDTRQTRDGVKITEVGPAKQLGPAEFKTGESACSGDSGGPAFASTSGAVLGVLSRGGNGSGDPGAANCMGTDTENVWTVAAAHADVIRAAYEKTGQPPWEEGFPNPRLGGLGADCAADDACQSGVCNGKQCSQLCDVDPCPGGWACKDMSGRKVCEQQVAEDDGCNTSGRSTSPMWSLYVLGALFAITKRRRATPRR